MRAPPRSSHKLKSLLIRSTQASRPLPSPLKKPAFRNSARDMDNIQVSPPPQLIPIVDQKKPGGSLPPKTEPGPTTPLNPPVSPAQKEADRQRKLANKQEAQRRRTFLREQREAQRLEIIQKQQPIVERERAQSFSWIEGQTSEFTPDQLLGRQIASFWHASRPPSKDTRSRQQVIQELQDFFDATWPEQQLTVAIFGSSSTGINHKDSDLDVTLLDPSRPLGVGTPPDQILPIGIVDPDSLELPNFYDVRTIARALRTYQSRRAGPPLFTVINPVSGANVPILKLETSKGLSLDININNRFGVLNSQLIKAYADLRPALFRPLCHAIKHWLKRRGLNDPSGSSGPSSLSSYSILLLIIQYLQIHKELPVLQNDDLIDHLEIPSHQICQEPKAVKRTAGDLPSGPGRTFLQARSYDVTFFDPSTKPQSIREVTEGGWRCWINEKLYDVDKLPSLEDWDEQIEIAEDDGDVDTPQQGLPNSDGIGLHKIDGEDAESLLGLHFRGFIEWYATLDRRNSIIDIRLGAVRRVNTTQDRVEFQKAQQQKDADGQTSNLLVMFDRNQPLEWENHSIITQDPFIIDRNTSRNILKQIGTAIELELHRALKILQANNTSTKAPVAQNEDTSTAPCCLLSDLCVPLAYTIAMENPPPTSTDADADDGKGPAVPAFTQHFRWPTTGPRETGGRRGYGGRGRGRGRGRGGGGGGGA